jgi:hypothetical protein
MSENNSTLPAAMKPLKAAEFLGMQRSKLYELLATGQIEARKSNKCTLVLTASMLKYLEQLPKAEFTSARGVERKAAKSEAAA